MSDALIASALRAQADVYAREAHKQGYSSAIRPVLGHAAKASQMPVLPEAFMEEAERGIQRLVEKAIVEAHKSTQLLAKSYEFDA